MTVTNVRAALASTILVNTVANVPAKFYGTMGTPHTFTDPVTSEVITIISDATAVDFAGSVSGATLNIDAIAPGYTDTRGSAVGDIIIIRPVTEWANNIFNILSAAHKDDGTLKNTSLDAFYKPSDIIYDFVQSGAVLAGLGYASNLNVSLSAGVCYIGGLRQTIAAVASRGYTASKDTYVDALYNVSGTATIVYTEVANNATAPALAANSIRLGIVVSGANILNAASVNQGQEDRVLPLVSSVPYSVVDGLGNLICPRDPQRQILGYRQRTVDFSTASTTAVQVTELSCPVIVPNGRKVKVTVKAGSAFQSAAANGTLPTIWEGAVVAGVLLGFAKNDTDAANYQNDITLIALRTPSSSSVTFNMGFQTGAGTGTLGTSYIANKSPIILIVELA